jgi:hypothetical protein
MDKVVDRGYNGTKNFLEGCNDFDILDPSICAEICRSVKA